MITVLFLLISIIFFSNLQASVLCDPLISFSYYGMEDNRHTFITNHAKSDSIGISLNKRAETIYRKEKPAQAFRILLPELDDGLHNLQINYYSSNSRIGSKIFPFFKQGKIVLLNSNYLWISRFDYINLVNKNSFNTQEEYNSALKKVLDKILAKASGSGITDIIFQVRGQGDVFYYSDIEPFSHLLSLNFTIGDDPGWDPLEFVIDRCRKYNLGIHLWINAFPIYYQGRNSFIKVRDGIILPKDRLSKFLVQDSKGNLPDRDGYIYLHPAHKEVFNYIIRILDELISKYNFEGIHFDYFRLEDNNYIYNSELLSEFRLVEGSMNYREFVQDRINKHLKGYYKFIKSRDPSITVSCAVIGRLRGKGFTAVNCFQSPAEWIEEGILDLIFPMTYFYPQLKDHLEEYKKEINPKYHSRIVPGIGAYLTLQREKDQPFSYISDSYRAISGMGSFGGVSFFSAESLVANNYWESIRALLMNR